MHGVSVRERMDDDAHASQAEREGELRVILVGRTGLDQSLRRDPGLELVRARGAMDAVGELADPIDEGSPRRTVVVVAPDAEPGESELVGFLEALRLVDSDVRVARVGGEAGAYDGVIDATVSGDGLRALFDRPGVSTPATQNGARRTEQRVAAARAPDESRRESVASRAQPAPEAADSPGDSPVLEELIRGRDPVPAALSLIRERLGRDDAEFVSADEGLRAGNPEAGCAEVRLGERLAGLLVLEGPAPTRSELEQLRGHARWLSGWLRLSEQQRALREAAFTDPLTGAWNRRYYDRYLSAAIDRAREARHTLTVMVFDIDDFKVYNDRYGHEAGDEILVQTVRLLESVIRPTDRVCRIGGDEFAVIFYEPGGPRRPDSNPPRSIYDIAQRFQGQICEHRFPKLGAEAQGTLTISGGLATFPWDGTDAASLLRRADLLALESKRQGKNAITLGPGAERVCKRPDA